MRHTLFSNRLENMFNQLNNYNSSTNMKILEKDLKIIDRELDVEYEKLHNPDAAKVRSMTSHSNFKKSSKTKLKGQISNVDIVADSIIEKLKNKDKGDKIDKIELISDRSGGLKSMASTFYNSVKKNHKPHGASQIIDSKNTTLKSFMLLSKTTLHDTITDKAIGTAQQTQTDVEVTPRGAHKEKLNQVLKKKLNNITKDINFKPLKLVNITHHNNINKVTEFKSNSAKNEYLIRDYTMGQYSVENSKKNMNITETFYDRIKKNKRMKMKNEMKNFYKNKYGDNVITDNSLSSIKDSDNENCNAHEPDYDKFNLKMKKYLKVNFTKIRIKSKSDRST
jgi:hypothetical protein